MMTFRGDVPKSPTGGTLNASVLKKSNSEGSCRWIGTFGARSARRDPLVFVAMLVVAPRAVGVNGEPECALNVSVVAHSPTTALRNPGSGRQRRLAPQGSTS